MYCRDMATWTYGRARIARYLAAVSLGCAWAGTAAADVQHVVARGHTIDAIAHRYHVSVKAIVDANHLRDPRHLKIGETLLIPGVSAPKSGGGGRGAATGSHALAHPPTYAMRARTPGVIHASRLASNEDFVVRVSSRRGHVAPGALKTFERVMRSAGGLTHAPDPRLISLVGQVSNHFGSRRLEIISGFRPYSPTQYTAHSNHNIGHALDFRIVGVPNEVLRDYCKTLHNVGVGYYPNSTFVHLDVRDTPATWIDYSRPGEPPRYSTPGVDADEGTSDVAEEAVTPESAAPVEVQPAAPPAGASPSAPAVPAPPRQTGPDSPSPVPTVQPPVAPGADVVPATPRGDPAGSPVTR